jgi:hypothetical protein
MIASTTVAIVLTVFSRLLSRPLAERATCPQGWSLRIWGVTIAYLVAVLLLVFAPAFAQKPADRLKCTFVTFATSAGVERERLELEFIVNTTTGKAVVVGNNGMEPVVLHSGNLGISLIEVVRSGVVQTTTIDNVGRAVHSRHTIVPGAYGFELFPSQYYGTCR